MSCQIISQQDVQVALCGMEFYGVIRCGASRNMPTEMMINMNILGKAILELNIQAFKARYEGRYLDEIDQDEQLAFAYARNALPATLLLTAKTLAYILYQCAEEPAVHEPLFGFLRECEAGLLRLFVEKLPEYQKLPWGF